MHPLVVTGPLRTLLFPGFLVPAFASIPRRLFSSSTQHCSRIGAAPLSIPPGVELTLIDPPSPRKNEMLRRVEPPKTIEVKGPLGQLQLPLHRMALTSTVGIMSIQIPSYMDFGQEPDSRKATLAVKDKNERTQREMWGELYRAT